MIRFNAAPAFDFNEWATLYQQDPQAFEARRQALLAIEIAKGGVHAPAGRRLLQQLEARLDGQSDAERIRLSMQAMADSARSLAAQMGSLKDDLQRYAQSLPSTPSTGRSQA